MTAGEEGGGGDASSTRGAGQVCAESGCERRAAVAVFVPWDEDRVVCPAHARALASQDGVVAEPIEGAEAEWP